MREIADLNELKSLQDTEVAVSDWVEITQERIDLFADATNDHQWIHVDVERCRRESPFGGTIAHGYLTLSLLPGMIESAFKMMDAKMVLNYGMNKLRFPAPVPVDSRLRASFILLTVTDIEGGAQMAWEVKVEREGSAKPVCVAELLLRRYP